MDINKHGLAWIQAEICLPPSLVQSGFDLHSAMAELSQQNGDHLSITLLYEYQLSYFG